MRKEQYTYRMYPTRVQVTCAPMGARSLFDPVSREGRSV